MREGWEVARQNPVNPAGKHVLVRLSGAQERTFRADPNFPDSIPFRPETRTQQRSTWNRCLPFDPIRPDPLPWHPVKSPSRIMASFRKRAGHWTVEVNTRGRREFATFHTKAEAAAWALEREAEIAGRKAHTGTVADVLHRYARDVSPTHRGERWEHTRLKRMERDPLAAVPIASLSPADIAAWRERRAQAVSGASVRREIVLLIVALEVAAVPFLLGMRLSPAMRVVSMVSGWLVLLGWFVTLILQNLSSHVIANNGLLGATVSLPVGWWSVLLIFAAGVLAAWAAWGMWALRHSK